MWENRPGKSMMRTIAVTAKKAAKVYVTLPSDELRDVYEALDTGSINRNTFVIAVEKDPSKSAVIKRKLSKLFRHSYVHAGQLYTLPLMDVLNGRQIDLAFFDLCGQLTEKVVRWMSQMDGREFATNAVVSFTLNLLYRDNHLMDRLDENSPRWKMIERIPSRCFQITVRPNFERIGLPIQILKTLYALYGGLSSVYKFSFDRIHEYHDTKQPMVFIQTTIDGIGRFTRNAISRHVIAICKELRPHYALDAKGNVCQSLRPCEILQCPDGMSAGQKAKFVRAAKKGNRPDWLKPSQWAWNPLNPKANKKAA